MKKIRWLKWFLFATYGAGAWVHAGSAPNILVIIADDFGGYSDIGYFGSEIRTPNLDALAKSSLSFNSFYVAPTCSPTRSMLFSGADNHLAGLGNMDELKYATPTLSKVPGYEGYLNFNVVTVADVLKDSGYRTYLSGKWHLGYTDDTSPAARGFDRSFALLDGAASHFDQAGIKSDIPKARYREDGKVVDLPETFKYSSDFYTEKLIDYLEGDKRRTEPFFAVLAFSAPHWPLQAPEDEIRKYHGVYDAGWERIREKRIANMKRLGLLEDGQVSQRAEVGWRRWSDLTDAERSADAKRMEIYAAMVTRLDYNVGRVMNYLKAQGLDQNTYVFFMSDNGPEGNDPRSVRGVGGWADSARFDNTYTNMGKLGSFIYLNPEWAHVSSTPYRLFKGFPSEGGIRVPLLVRPVGLGEESRGRTITGVFNVMDLTPTFKKIAGIDKWPTHYRGRAVAALAGTPIESIFGSGAPTDATQKIVAREFLGRKSLRRGDWKILWIESPKGKGRWELYDVKLDPAEKDDRAATHKDILEELIALWEDYVAKNNIRSGGGVGGYGN